jgi:hypothetical protein
MRDGTEDEWVALQRLKAGDGSKADFELLAIDFRQHHLDPALMSLPAMLWMDLCLERLLAGEKPSAVFARPRTGRPPQNSSAYKVFATLRFLQEKRALKSTDAARAVVLDEFHKTDWRNFERDLLLGDFGSRWTDEEIARRIEIYRHMPRVISRDDISP